MEQIHGKNQRKKDALHTGNSIGLRIAQLRGELRSQRDIADALGVSRETVTQWENGTRRIKDVDIVMLADYFGVSCDYILRGVSSDNIGINKLTGLSEKAIEFLKAENEKKNRWISTADFFETLLTHDLYEDMLDYVNDCYKYGLVDKLKEVSNDSTPEEQLHSMEMTLLENGRILVDSYEAVTYSRYEAAQCFEDIVRDFIESSIYHTEITITDD